MLFYYRVYIEDIEKNSNILYIFFKLNSPIFQIFVSIILIYTDLYILFHMYMIELEHKTQAKWYKAKMQKFLVATTGQRKLALLHNFLHVTVKLVYAVHPTYPFLPAISHRWDGKNIAQGEG